MTFRKKAESCDCANCGTAPVPVPDVAAALVEQAAFYEAALAQQREVCNSAIDAMRAAYDITLDDLREQVRWLRAQTAPTVHPAPFSEEARVEREFYRMPVPVESPDEYEEDAMYLADRGELDPESAKLFLESQGLTGFDLEID